MKVQGELQKLLTAGNDPVAYEMPVGKDLLPLNDLIGQGLALDYLHQISCCHCGATTRKSYGGGYCYPCFKKLAQCDLCVVSPDRCHYHLGTCREPEWGEAFCMHEHLVYLANSSGPKVGITRRDGEQQRWRDQGATQAVPVVGATTRHLAGVVEVMLGRHVTDRTDWRRLVSADSPPVDLIELRDDLQAMLPELPEGARWLTGEAVTTIRYPVTRYGATTRLTLTPQQDRIEGLLVGIKGQFLLFDRGVFNVRQHRSYHVRVEPIATPAPAPGDAQRELF